jgi:glucokinase
MPKSNRVLVCELSENMMLHMADSQPGQLPQSFTPRRCANSDDLISAIKTYISNNTDGTIEGIGLSAPGWERDGEMSLTHMGFSLKREQIKYALHIKRLHLLNDCVAKALAVPQLEDTEVRPLNQTIPQPESPMALIAAGHGLGLSYLVPHGLDSHAPIASEGGHSDISANSEREDHIIAHIRKRFGTVSRERILSLSGIGLIYETISQLDGHKVFMRPSVASIADQAMQGDPVAYETCGLFSSWLGAMAADCALIYGAGGGVYLSGDALDDLGNAFDSESFNQRFNSKARMKVYLSKIPVFQIKTNHLQIKGLMRLFDDLKPTNIPFH